MSGNDDSKPEQEKADAEVAKMTRLLDEYETSLGLPATSFSECEATKILTLSPQRLKQLTATDCGEYAFMLNQYATHLQRAINREKAIHDWADDVVRRLIAKSVGNAKGYFYDERRTLAVANSPLASQFDTVRRHAKNCMNTTEYMANRIDNMAKSLSALQSSKRGHRD